ncbi:uncharacterized protein EI90DRAFT_3029464 [Cantharellus anzutake]|uniref:uncharacterized protein n=1 Tax=Cantharellus anzutake TaxID=1750568 RepID=UPI0019061D92|nr:uncharacterized protein EI90DRAFT_3029464 [Cantharellus anzutake]KAF8342572.1 hypothetical protein EI90DRAFT_3029464 [Cantharellus anzutake]
MSLERLMFTGMEDDVVRLFTSLVEMPSLRTLIFSLTLDDCIGAQKLINRFPNISSLVLRGMACTIYTFLKQMNHFPFTNLSLLDIVLDWSPYSPKSSLPSNELEECLREMISSYLSSMPSSRYYTHHHHHHLRSMVSSSVERYRWSGSGSGGGNGSSLTGSGRRTRDDRRLEKVVLIPSSQEMRDWLAMHVDEVGGSPYCTREAW